MAKDNIPFYMKEVEDDQVVLPEGAANESGEDSEHVERVDLGSIQAYPGIGASTLPFNF